MQKINALLWVALLAKGVTSVAVWGQCGGIGYTGSTVCDSGTTCVVVNDWYYQCQPGSAATTSATSATSATGTTAAPTSTPTLSLPRAALTEISNFGSNPTNVRNYAYVPQNLKSSPGLLVAMHYCTGTAQAYFSGTGYKALADQYGFILLYPTAPDSGGCWDVHSNATLTHDAGGDSLGIASGMRYLISGYAVNPSKVFVTGSSSGAMMTNVMAGAYPDLIKGGAAFAGVPYACFSGTSTWSSTCATGQLIKTAQQWGDLVRQGYPGYTGTRPKMQLWHGSADTTLYTQNFYEEVKQWTNVFNVSQTATATTQNWPISGWTKSDYGSNVQAILANGVTHDLPVRATEVIQYFGLNL